MSVDYAAYAAAVHLAATGDPTEGTRRRCFQCLGCGTVLTLQHGWLSCGRCQGTGSQKQTRAACTLVELIAAIAILLVLVGPLVPAICRYLGTIAH